MPPSKTLIVIAGPTAVGKTDLAIRLAQYFDTEILSADSRQFYREMNIGTAKPSQTELGLVKHHFIDSLSITNKFTAGDFEKQGLAALSEIFKKNDKAILAGGSGLFINALCHGFDEIPKASPETRERLNKLYSEQGLEAIQLELKKVDPFCYAEVDKNNPQRIIRALEVWQTGGRSILSYRKPEFKARPFTIIKIALNTARNLLYERINVRVDLMIKAGLVEEAQSLVPFRHLNALNTVGYSELFKYFDGELSLVQAIEQIKQNTRRFAKRQLTWFRKDENIHWFEPGQDTEVLALISKTTD